MTGQRGRDILLKISDGAEEPTYITVAGIRATTIELNAQQVDATTADSPAQWRELLGGAGIRTARVEGQGVFKDQVSDLRMREVFFANQIADWQLILPGLGRLLGGFQISRLNWSGEYNSEATFTVELQSAGALEFEAET